MSWGGPGLEMNIYMNTDKESGGDSKTFSQFSFPHNKRAHKREQA